MDALRSALQPVTHNLPKPVANLGESLLNPICYKTLVYNVDLTATECVKLAISKGLDIGIVGAPSILKVPQLLKLINSQSAEGLSFLSYFLDTYGETALILVQNIAIACLVLKYSGNLVGIAEWLGGLIAAGAALFNEGWVDNERLSFLQATAGVLSVASKVPQILTIWSEGGTGQLSAFAVVNYPLGSLSRIFTTLQEVDDPLLLYGFIAGFAFNAVLSLQVIYYWNAPTSKDTESKKLD
ncbi:hypothetical protein AA0119_g13175 [Alternaria tenuissima]|uniref:Mannose-P-dolichol utilization defect 1 protein homolog n=1 Tax=Alternaria tenuissima TaxID=119927 RepID=A0ABY0FPA5_9PLEO|nr:hypothetical protein AA0119_g13175 [Alternaria tenuissima]RYO07616.1 hypothetical protein AA0121_g11705 [Alternaria tenuissima]